jgi:tRNA G18 (ribose-2'-O)-methylase SpoU
MALLSPLGASAEEVRATLAPLRNDFSVALYTAENAFAVGAVIRVAHNFLAREIILVGQSPYYEKASMGMEKFETIVRISSDDALLAHVGSRPILAIEKDYATTSLYDITFPKNVVLLFGSERFGIPKHIVRKANLVVGIPIYGVNHSLPLAVASGIVMSEWARRRYRNGATA